MRKEAARIELPRDLVQFQRIANAGKQLAKLHLNYERLAPAEEIEEEKMKNGGKRPNLDKTVIHFNRY